MRILFVAHGYSIHTARWIRQFADEKWDLHLVPVNTQVGNFHRDLRDITIHPLFKSDVSQAHPSVTLKGVPLAGPLRRGRGIFRDALASLPGDPTAAGSRIARTIKSVRPDVVHSMEWGAGAMTLDAFERLQGSFPPWIHSIWTDLSWFGKKPECAARVRQLMSSCRYLMADCQRELDLAPSHGFTGELLGAFPGAGGYRIDHMRQLRSAGPPSSRRLIVLKGRQDTSGGRALVALQALDALAPMLSDYEIAIYGASDVVRHAARYVAQVTGLRIQVVPPFTPHDDMMTIMGRARVAIGLGITDGTPQAMFEAMVMGALPIQSTAADTRGWIEDGKNGFVVPAEDPDAVAMAIRRALTDERLVDDASDINERLTRERIDISVIEPRIVSIYDRVAASRRASRA